MLLIVSAPTLIWSGSQGSTWNTSTPNWNKNGAAAAYSSDSFAVVFADNPANASSGTAGVSLANGSTFQPLSVTFQNTAATAYLLGGSGTLGGASTSVAILGGGNVTLSSSNAYLYAGSTAVNNGSTLVLGGTLANSPVSVTGGNVGGAGSINQTLGLSGASNLMAGSNLTVAGLTTVGGAPSRSPAAARSTPTAGWPSPAARLPPPTSAARSTSAPRVSTTPAPPAAPSRASSAARVAWRSIMRCVR